jgi:molybdopterin converting factor small subunit
MPATVRVLLFATAREAVGRRELRVPVDAQGLAVGELLIRLTQDYPRLASVARSCRVVLNGRFIDGQGAVARPGDELALHPPYSGG